MTGTQDGFAVADILRVAATPRFRALQRQRVRDAARHGMAVALAAAVIDTIWLVPLHPGASELILELNVIISLVAVSGYVAITTLKWHPDPFAFLMLAVVDVAALVLGILRPEMGDLASGYLLLLPLVVALVILWPTRIHVAWLAFHGAAVLLFADLAPQFQFAGGRGGDLLTLLLVASVVSLFGHVAGLRARVLAYVQIQRIQALNRKARRDEQRLARLNRILEETARTDELTGLRNRLSLNLDLAVIRARIQRYGESYSLLMLDLDHFKGINDEYGHVVGDAVLRSIAKELTRAVRQDDTVYRFGGEELVVLMRVTDPSDSRIAAERLRAAVESLAIPHPRNPPYGCVTVSVGEARMGPADLTADDAWIGRADAALYRAKSNGRNTSETESVAASRHDATRTALRTGLRTRAPEASASPLR